MITMTIDEAIKRARKASIQTNRAMYVFGTGNHQFTFDLGLPTGTDFVCWFCGDEVSWNLDHSLQIAA